MITLNVEKLILFLAIVFLHYVWFRPFNFPLTLAPAALIWFFLFAYNTREAFTNSAFVYILLFIVGLPWLGALQLGFEGADALQFARTYALWVTSALAIAAACFVPLRAQVDLAAPATIALLTITACVALQAITSQRGDHSYFNFFGSHQYFGEIELETLATEDRLRPPGFYLEPSFCAYVITNLTSICLIQKKHQYIAICTGAVGILFIQSLTGLLAFTAVLLFYAYGRRGSQATNKRSMLAPILIGALPFIGIAWHFYSDYIADRAAQVDEVGSSTYYRVAGLLPVLKDTLIQHPLGYALGRVKEVVPKYMIPHGTGYGESIDNGLYLLIFYFGWFGAIAVLLIMASCVYLFCSGRRSQAFCITVILLGCFFNGGIMLPEFALLTVLLIYASRLSPDF